MFKHYAKYIVNIGNFFDKILLFFFKFCVTNLRIKKMELNQL